MAFALAAYCELLEALRASGYGFRPVRSYFEGTAPPVVFLRHDVDRLPSRARGMAAAEAALGVTATYYFRCDGRGTFPAAAVTEIARMGHEVGFHYETMARHRGRHAEALEAFRRELAALRELGVEVVTVAAHGSPLSRHSNLGLSDQVDLESLGLLGEPGLHFDFSSVLYVTDTGGIFGSRANLRDRVAGRNFEAPTTPAALPGRLDPGREPRVLLSAHPERWPRGRLGVLVQSAVDGGANALKRIRGALA